MANTKITKAQRFMELKAIVKDNADLVAFIDHELELLEKKAQNRGNGKKAQAENAEKDALKNAILETLASSEKALTVTEMQGANEVLGAVSNQKVSALVKQLVEGGAVVRSVEKGKAIFEIA